MAEWKAECSSDSECENLLVAIGEQFKSKELVQVLSSMRAEQNKLNCVKNIKRKKMSKKVKVVGDRVGESWKQEHDMGASDTTPTDMRSPLSAGSRDLQHTLHHQQQRFATYGVHPRISRPH